MWVLGSKWGEKWEKEWQKEVRRQMVGTGRGREGYGQSRMINQSRFRVHIRSFLAIKAIQPQQSWLLWAPITESLQSVRYLRKKLCAGRYSRSLTTLWVPQGRTLRGGSLMQKRRQRIWPESHLFHSLIVILGNQPLSFSFINGEVWNNGMSGQWRTLSGP